MFILTLPLFLSLSGMKQGAGALSQFAGLVVPESETARRALTEREIPSSLPPLLEYRPLVSPEIDFSALQPVEIPMQAVLPFYLSAEAPDSVGSVVSKDGYGRLTALGGEQLVVRMEGDTVLGSVFTVFEDRGRVGGWFSFVSAGDENREVMIKAKIRIVSRLASPDYLYLASVEEALQAVTIGDSLFAGEPPMYDSSQKGETGEGEGLIVGAPGRRLMMSVGSFVYLDKGLEDGIENDRFFYIFGNRISGRFLPRPYKYNLPVLGKLKIVRAGASVSTALITESRDQIYAGDMFAGDPDRLENLDIYLDYEEVKKDTEGQMEEDPWDGEDGIAPENREDYEWDDEEDEFSEEQGDAFSEDDEDDGEDDSEDDYEEWDEGPGDMPEDGEDDSEGGEWSDEESEGGLDEEQDSLGDGLGGDITDPDREFIDSEEDSEIKLEDSLPEEGDQEDSLLEEGFEDGDEASDGAKSSDTELTLPEEDSVGETGGATGAANDQDFPAKRGAEDPVGGSALENEEIGFDENAGALEESSGAVDASQESLPEDASLSSDKDADSLESDEDADSPEQPRSDKEASMDDGGDFIGEDDDAFDPETALPEEGSDDTDVDF